MRPLFQRAKDPSKLVLKPRWETAKDEINVSDNPITTPPKEIVEQGNDAVLRYFERISNEGIDYLYEAKLTLVGEGNAGKTSLQKRLVNDIAPLPTEDDRTRGILIIDWAYEGPGEKKHIAHIWDFGGQDVYYPVHRFFLTEDSVFVLLASTRQTLHYFDYWIPTIFQFGGNSPIIIGQTCHQGNKVPWNDLGYYLSNDDFNIIKTGQRPYIELNLLNNNEGLKEIKKAIIDQIELLPHYGKGVPKSWIPAREAIAETAKTKDCISFEDFTKICLKTNAEKFASKIDVEDFAHFLHALGIVLWYSDIEELQHWVILQPEWAMNAVYKIIDDDTIQERRGHISATDFSRIWAEKCYEYRFEILKKMLQVFKIAFRKKHEKLDFIIPCRLDSIPHELIWKDDAKYLRLVYKYNFMPRGLVNQLSADLSRHIKSDSDVWNNAVNFEHKDTKAQAQVVEDFYNRSISIRVTGKDARGLMMLIIEAMRDVIDSYKRVTPSIIVPCPCQECKRSDNPTTFEYEKLLKWSETKPSVHCNEGDVKLPIEELLYNVGLTNDKKKTRPLKAFISYSKHDGELAKNGGNYLDAFKKHLSPLSTHTELIQPWDDTLLIAGEDWDKKIREQLNTCDIIFLLISPDFLNTKYIQDTELQIAIKRHENRECIVVPVIVRACGWTDIPMLSKLSALPRKGDAVASWKNNINWQTIDDAWKHVYDEVKKLIDQFAKKTAE
ncbi:COR domain-containing protein [Niastella vici]|uniref:COR domain-containing protein n=1 Tax=Niastella vici TaxID=1703345 RepID=UPI001301AA49|nr:COR domain-containing protein [Niastella vici]